MMPRAEHPRPQWKRDDWLCLNGEWEFEIDWSDTGRDRGLVEKAPLAGKITVPFCPESRLSGVACRDFMRAVWYRRKVRIPTEWKLRRVLLHFQAVDYAATVWVNGSEVARHTGGWCGFSADITSAAGPGDEAVIVVRARDDARNPEQPGGKQSPQYDSHGCFYTRTTGIWQTVWLEAVPEAHLERPAILPDLDAQRVHVTVGAAGVSDGWMVKAELRSGSKTVATDTAPAARHGTRLVLQVPEKDLRVWSTEGPFLYDLVLTLLEPSAKAADKALAYAGIRKVDTDGKAVRLNGRRLFLRTVLDQGYYPDGVMTAPSDEALKRDIELSMKCGFNGARLHQKVFEERFLYWADRLGYIVWGEFGDWGAERREQRSPASWVRQWMEVVRRDMSHPSIIGWCPLNETHGVLHDSPQPLDELTLALYDATRAVDPTRLVLDVSGYSHRVREIDVYDCHDYAQDPREFADNFAQLDAGKPRLNASNTIESIPYAGQPFFVSEMGGTWWNPAAAAAAGEKSWGYGERPGTQEEYVQRFRALTGVMLENPHICGYCYTQLTDVEQEQNGVLYFDRTQKVDPAVLAEAQRRPAKIERRGA